MSAIADLYQEVASYGSYSPEYVDKMLHKVPDAPVFNRAEYLLKAAKGKVVLDIGASGKMSEALQRVARRYYGIDDEPYDEALIAKADDFWPVNIERVDTLPEVADLDLIIAGEVIEHLSNAGRFLDLVWDYGVPVILTTPNAFGVAGNQHIKNSVESVNKEHVAWYSYHTLKTLIERHNFKLLLWAWYNGKPLTAEGLIFHMEPEHGND